ncbi:cation:proton antiporter [bacterium]|nr:cation:proton antiporter [bacterium]
MIFIIIFLGGWFFGKISAKMALPSVFGMVLFGVILSPYFKNFSELWSIAPVLKIFALTVILLRSGLGIKRETLKQIGKTAFFLSWVPCVFEGVSLMIFFRYFFDFSWSVSGVTAFMLAAVSPAVVVPSMLDLKENGYGKKNEVPTLVLAGASIDDVFAITFFTIFLGISTSKIEQSIIFTLLSIPYSIILGVLLGVLLGFILYYIFKKHKNINSTEKILILLTISLLFVEFGNFIKIAPLLGVMTIGYILTDKLNQKSDELAKKLKIVWFFAEITLFVIIGLSIDIKIAISGGILTVLAIFFGLIFRSIGVIIATSFSKLTKKERLFCVISYLPKATVQAALGGIPLASGIKEGNVILSIAVLSILLTAPAGLIGIRVFGKRLLDK